METATTTITTTITIISGSLYCSKAAFTAAPLGRSLPQP